MQLFFKPVSYLFLAIFSLSCLGESSQDSCVNLDDKTVDTVEFYYDGEFVELCSTYELERIYIKKKGFYKYEVVSNIPTAHKQNNVKTNILIEPVKFKEQVKMLVYFKNGHRANLELRNFSDLVDSDINELL